MVITDCLLLISKVILILIYILPRDPAKHCSSFRPPNVDLGRGASTCNL